MRHETILRAAALLVPADERAEWIDEWTAELAYVRHESPRRALWFCLGAFRDALWVRRNNPAGESRDILLASPLRCLLVLSAMAAICVVLAYQLPGPRSLLVQRVSPDGERQVLITRPVGKLSYQDYQWLAQRLPWEFTDITYERGRVLAYRRPGIAHVSTRWRFYIPKENGDEATYNCSIPEEPSPLTILAFTGGMALLILIGTTPLSIGQYPKLQPARGRLWAFFAAKVALAMTIVFFGVLDLGSASVVEIRPHGLLVGFVVVFRWALKDQRRRCPVCLRGLTNPVHFGQAAHVFLDWYGTELICAEGHGMMHFPEIPTSCYPEPRWVRLDA
jgi:hypothetical protein